jgi:hypothetical protein
MMCFWIQSNSEVIQKHYGECFYSIKFRSDKKTCYDEVLDSIKLRSYPKTLAMMSVWIQSNSEAIQKHLL